MKCCIRQLISVARLQVRRPWTSIAAVALVVLFLAAGCTGSSADPAQLEATIAEAAHATVQAIPAATALPTYTAAPSQTPNPTYTPLATYTPFPTYTPLPTYAPLPTETPEPTLTPTPTASPVPTQAAVAAEAPAQAASGSAADRLDQAIRDMLAAINNTEGIIGAGFGKTENRIVPEFYPSIRPDCQAYLANYDAVANRAPLDLGGDEFLRALYLHYERALGIFLERSWDMADNCRNSVANQEVPSIPDIQYGKAREGISGANAILHQLLRDLGREPYEHG